MAVPAVEAPVNERYRGATLYALFVIAGLIALSYSWMTVQHRLVPQLSSATEPVWSHNVVAHWIDHGYFASHGLLWPTADGNTLYRNGTGALMLSSFVAEKIWIGVTGRYAWRLMAIHNLLVTVLVSALLALLAYRLARRFGAAPLAAFLLAVSAQMVWLTFPDNLSLFWHYVGADLVPGRRARFSFARGSSARRSCRTRRITVLQGLAVFASSTSSCAA